MFNGYTLILWIYLYICCKRRMVEKKKKTVDSVMKALLNPSNMLMEYEKIIKEILDNMVSGVKSSIRQKIQQAAKELEGVEGVEPTTICHLISQRAEEMETNAAYVRECLPTKYKDPAQRNIRLSKIGEGGGQNLTRSKSPEKGLKSHQKERYQIPGRQG